MVFTFSDISLAYTKRTTYSGYSIILFFLQSHRNNLFIIHAKVICFCLFTLLFIWWFIITIRSFNFFDILLTAWTLLFWLREFFILFLVFSILLNILLLSLYETEGIIIIILEHRLIIHWFRLVKIILIIFLNLYCWGVIYNSIEWILFVNVLILLRREI